MKKNNLNSKDNPYNPFTQFEQEMYELESHIHDTSTDITMVHNGYGKPIGTVRDLPDNDSLAEAIRKEPYITDDTEIIGVKYYFRNN